MMPESILAIRTTVRLQGSIPLWGRTIQRRFLKSTLLLCDIEDADIMIILKINVVKNILHN